MSENKDIKVFVTKGHSLYVVKSASNKEWERRINDIHNSTDVNIEVFNMQATSSTSSTFFIKLTFNKNQTYDRNSNLPWYLH